MKALLSACVMFVLAFFTIGPVDGGSRVSRKISKILPTARSQILEDNRTIHVCNHFL
jgi:hypothetical protein